MVDNFPTPPSLGAEETLAFFTHKSLRTSMKGVDLLYGDHEGLEAIGNDMLRSSLYEACIRNHEGMDLSVDALQVCAYRTMIVHCL